MFSSVFVGHVAREGARSSCCVAANTRSSTTSISEVREADACRKKSVIQDVIRIELNFVRSLNQPPPNPLPSLYRSPPPAPAPVLVQEAGTLATTHYRPSNATVTRHQVGVDTLCYKCTSIYIYIYSYIFISVLVVILAVVLTVVLAVAFAEVSPITPQLARLAASRTHVSPPRGSGHGCSSCGSVRTRSGESGKRERRREGCEPRRGSGCWS